MLRPLQDRDPSRFGELLVQAALAAVVVERLVAVASDLQLWGDGVFFLTKIAVARGYFFWFADFTTDFFRSRIFTTLILQTPTVLAARLGVDSLPALSRILGLTLYGHALLSLFVCSRLTPRRWLLLFPLLSLFAGSMNVEAYLITDGQFLPSLYWPALFVLLFAAELRGRTLGLLVALSVPMLLCYESMLFLGLVLAGTCAWRWRRSQPDRIVLAVFGAWYVLGAALAAASILWPFDPTNRKGFVGGLVGVVTSDHLAARVSLGVTVCCALLLLVPSRIEKLRTGALAMGLSGIAFLVVEILSGAAPASLDSQGAARTLNLVLPLAASALLLAVRFAWVRVSGRTIQFLAILVGALGLAQALWALRWVTRWEGMRATLRHELSQREGPIAYDDSALSRKLGPLDLGRLHSGWPLVALSIFESEGGTVRSIVLPPPGVYLPYDPLNPSTLPDLSRYGVTYDPYVAALRKRSAYRFGEALTFSGAGTVSMSLGGGWSFAEKWARWTAAQDSDLELGLADPPGADPYTLEVQVVPYLPGPGMTMTVDVEVNDVPVGTFLLRHLPRFEVRRLQAAVPGEALAKANPARIRFHVREPLRSPAEVEGGADPRKLGLAFLEMRLTRSVP